MIIDIDIDDVAAISYSDRSVLLLAKDADGVESTLGLSLTQISLLAEMISLPAEMPDVTELEKKAYDKAATDIKGEVRKWLVDLNYQMFHTDDGVLRSKIYAALQSGMTEFDKRTNRI